MSLSRPIALDVFCGVGGMSLGFEQAGFHVIGAFDRESFNIESHRLNFPSSKAFEVDLAECSGDDLLALCGSKHDTVDLLFGGPPCQGFSVGGKRDLDDPRNLLVYDFARLIREVKPNYFVMENVRGLTLTHSRQVLTSFVRRVKLAGYSVVEPIQVLNAADFGVPQRRHRTFVIGGIKGLPLPCYPEKTGCFDEHGNEFYPVVCDAISDLPKVDDFAHLFESDTFDGELAETTNPYALMMRGELLSYDDLSESRTNPSAITGCYRTAHSQQTLKRFRKTPQGKAEPVSRYIRLAWNEVSPTLRAGTGTERGSHTAPRPIHPVKPRCITTREAARLHSFPDWFQFHGTRWHDFRQIGNSVPPLLAKAVGKQIIAAIQNERKLK